MRQVGFLVNDRVGNLRQHQMPILVRKRSGQPMEEFVGKVLSVQGLDERDVSESARPDVARSGIGSITELAGGFQDTALCLGADPLLRRPAAEYMRDRGP